jgi:6-phosphofructokinase 2
MIYTLTLNPSLEKIIDVEEFVYDDVNVILDEKRSAEGKGIDVSRVIKELGGQSVALGFMGGYNGLEVEGRLASEGILCDFTRVSGETRTNINIHQQRKKMQTLLSAAAAEVTEFDVAILYNRIKQIPRGSHMVMTGSMPPGLNDNFYAQIIAVLKNRGVRTFLDADGEALKAGVLAGPYLMKPNIHEFGRLLENNLKDQEEVLEHAATYLDLAEFVVVSMGVRGAVGVSRKEKYFVSPPKVNVKSSIGAGDALLAGIVFGLSEGASFKDALSLGVACGTASTLNAGQGVCMKDDVYAIMKQVSMKNA